MSNLSCEEVIRNWQIDLFKSYINDFYCVFDQDKEIRITYVAALVLILTQIANIWIFRLANRKIKEIKKPNFVHENESYSMMSVVILRLL